MLKRFATLLVLAIVMLGLAGAPGHAAAQQTNASALGLKDLKGIDTAYQRTYTVDIQAMMTTPAAKPGAINGLFGINAIVIKFDNAANAKDALDKLSGTIQQLMNTSGANGKLDKADLKGISDKAYSYTTSINQEGMTGQAYMALARQDKYIHLVIGISLGNANPKDDMIAFLKQMVTAKEGADSIKPNPQGFNTGGMYDKLPLTDVPGKLTPGKGVQVYPAPAATPTMSTPACAPVAGQATPPC